MKVIGLCVSLITALLVISCGTTRGQHPTKASDLEVTGSIEITEYDKERISEELCTIKGKFVDEDGEVVIGMKVYIEDPLIGTMSDVDGSFQLRGIPAGSHTLVFEYIGVTRSTVKLELAAGDHVTLEGILAMYSDVKLLKPIIYLYPEEETEVHVELNYDGELTTTYPSYPETGWNVTAKPDGTLFDQKGREYYSLYWEGKPRQPLIIPNGFVVSKEETISFLEEKLELLGLNAKEANEFIIFWLPVLEKNAFNVIHFAEEDYLAQAQLTVSPQPETMIRIAMVFQGLDEPIDISTQDLTSLQKTRKGFTLVEWGGQELPKRSKREI